MSTKKESANPLCGDQCDCLQTNQECTCGTNVDKKEKPETPVLTAEEIAHLNKLVGNIDDDNDRGKGDLTQKDLDLLSTILFKDNT